MDGEINLENSQLFLDREKEAEEIYDWINAVVVSENLTGEDTKVILEYLDGKDEFRIRYFDAQGGCALEVSVCTVQNGFWDYYLSVHGFYFVVRLADKEMKFENIYLNRMEEMWEYLKVIYG